jgi:hypothetical protein
MQQRNEIADKSADHNSISRQTKFPKPIFLFIFATQSGPQKKKNLPSEIPAQHTYHHDTWQRGCVTDTPPPISSLELVLFVAVFLFIVVCCMDQ